ncbi:helix-turn-helix domain-containing protein [Thermogemmatispora onikobensis]|uniref:helix-turn-helix domain-containing protein n=1 Tax=Thermogemmatispora onikobensis TaxID=732234 RepID=UPI0008528FB8|nr:helix-turn-helix transcriptional regulator [Thermogemmatispora onikobensis]
MKRERGQRWEENSALRKAREERGWSREYLASVLGTNAFTIYRWESGRAYPGPYFRQKLCAAFGYEPTALGLTGRKRHATPPLGEPTNPHPQPTPSSTPPLSTFWSHLPLQGRTALLNQLRNSPRLAARLAPHRIVPVPPLEPAAALELLRMLAPQAVNQEPALAMRLVEAVGGLPLAILLLGSHLYEESLYEQPRRIAAAFRCLLERPARWFSLCLPASGNHAGLLRESLQRSLARLPSAALALLHSLAVFSPQPNSFSEEAAAAVCLCEATTFTMALDLLCDSGLLECRAARYSLHPVVGAYLRLDQPELSAAERHLVDYYAALVRQQLAAGSPPSLVEQENLQTALQLAKQHTLCAEQHLLQAALEALE